MQRIGVPQGTNQDIQIGRAGPTLLLVNNPAFVDEGSFLLQGQIIAAVPGAKIAFQTVFVGFDRTPSEAPGGYDAILPPFSAVSLHVPGSVGTIHLLAPVSAVATWGAFPASGSSTPILYDWMDCEEPSGLAGQSGLPAASPNAAALSLPVDLQGFVWPPSTPGYVWDQAYWGGGLFRPQLRPLLGTAAADTIHQLTAANTLFNFTGALNFLGGLQNAPANLQVVKRIIVSVSAACLFVVGGPGLAVGSPGAQEAGRIAFAAAGTQVIDYGESGLRVDALGTSGAKQAWQAYTSAIVTLDATVIGG
jgi:hypothetical protein